MDLFRTQSYTHGNERKPPLTYSFLNTKLQTSSFSKLSPRATYTELCIIAWIHRTVYVQGQDAAWKCSAIIFCVTFSKHLYYSEKKKNLGLFWLIYCACTHTRTPYRSQTALNIGSSDLFTVNHVGCRCAAAGMKLTCLATTYLDWWWSRFCMGMPPNAATAAMIPCTTLQWDEQQPCV